MAINQIVGVYIPIIRLLLLIVDCFLGLKMIFMHYICVYMIECFVDAVFSQDHLQVS